MCNLQAVQVWDSWESLFIKCTSTHAQGGSHETQHLTLIKSLGVRKSFAYQLIILVALMEVYHHIKITQRIDLENRKAWKKIMLHTLLNINSCTYRFFYIFFFFAKLAILPALWATSISIHVLWAFLHHNKYYFVIWLIKAMYFVAWI